VKAARFLTLAPLRIAQALVGFGAIAAFTRLMSAEDFGRYALALSVSMAAHALLFAWAEAAAFRFYATSQAARRLSDHYATLTAIAVALALATLFALSFVITRIGLPQDAATLAAFVTGSTLLRFMTRMARECDRAGLAFTRYAVLETAYLALGFAAGIALLLVFDLGAAAPFAGLALGGMIVVLADAPRLVKEAKGGYVTFARARRYAGYGAPLALALAVDLGVQAFACIILTAQTGDASLGAYAAAFGLARPLELIFLGVSAAFSPLVFAAYEQKGAEEARAAARRAFATLVAATLPACVGLMLASEPLAALVVGEELRVQAAMALPWLAVAGLFSGFTLYYWSEAYQLTHRSGRRALLMLAPGAVQLALTFLLARDHGAVGAALAAAGGAVVGCVVLAVAGRRLFAMPAKPAASTCCFSTPT
jgi:O-antigen/teichoic acid export membrane protein